MHPSATRDAFYSLSEKQQHALAVVLTACRDNNLSCRCEMTGGREFTLIISPGLSAPQHWLNRFDIPEGVTGD